MNLFVDTNVLLDVMANRQPFYEASAEVWSLAERGEVRAYISAISFNNIYYVIRKLKNRKTAEKALRLLRDIFDSVPPDRKILDQAIDAEFDDFEDAVQFYSALRVNSACLITRNPRHFPNTSLPVLTPEEFLTTFSKQPPPGDG